MTKVPQRPVGTAGLVASAQGLGCMGMTAFYGPPIGEEQAIEIFGKALEHGINFIDTAWMYQDAATGQKNEVLVGKALRHYGRDKFVVATKFGVVYNKDGTTGVDSSKEMIHKQLEESLSNLGTSHIDLYYQHRPDPKVDIEEVMWTLRDLVKEGKVRFVGLSECTPDELRRAHAIHPVSAIQMEWSLQTRDLEKEVVPTARELGIAIVAYSPLGRGLLSNRFTSKEDMSEQDWRKKNPRFAEGNFEKNAESAARLAEIAKEKGVSAGQLALAWVHNQGEDVFPIPGTRSPSRLEENAHAASVKLSQSEMRRLEVAVPEAVGERYQGMHGTFNQRV